MDICGHLMQKCFQTREFNQPQPVSIREPEEEESLIFDEKDNAVNLRRCKKKNFYDASICRHLCSSSLVLNSKKNSPINSCEGICFELTKSSESSGEICPFEKYCANGCPCKHFFCEKISDKYQEKIPVWDFESKKSRNMTEEDLKISIYQRREDLERKPETSGFDVLLFDFNSPNSSSEVFLQGDVLFPHERILNNHLKISIEFNLRILKKVAGSAFLNGEHYLIEARGKMTVFSLWRNEILTSAFRDRFYKFGLF